MYDKNEIKALFLKESFYRLIKQLNIEKIFEYCFNGDA
jgi:hypothetical protein